MEYLNAANIDNEEINKVLKEIMLKGEKEIIASNIHAMHNVAAGLQGDITITFEDSTGLYTASYLEGPRIVVNGNVGWYAGDNMVDGELIIQKNTGCNVGAYIAGGDIVIYGNTGSRVGYGMKGGHIVVGGNAGRWAGQMAMGGNLIILGTCGQAIGESMFMGKIFTRDKDARDKLGGNVALDAITEEESKELDELFQRYDFMAEGSEFNVIRPILNASGKHKYVLFKPDLKPELAAKYRSGGIYGRE